MTYSVCVSGLQSLKFITQFKVNQKLILKISLEKKTLLTVQFLFKV